MKNKLYHELYYLCLGFFKNDSSDILEEISSGFFSDTYVCDTNIKNKDRSGRALPLKGWMFITQQNQNKTKLPKQSILRDSPRLQILHYLCHVLPHSTAIHTVAALQQQRRAGIHSLLGDTR